MIAEQRQTQESEILKKLQTTQITCNGCQTEIQLPREQSKRIAENLAGSSCPIYSCMCPNCRNLTLIEYLRGQIRTEYVPPK
jgi:hypothetical protein